MTDRMTRGYAITQMLDYIERTYDADIKQRIFATIPQETKDVFPSIQPTGWYGWEHNAALLRAIASIKESEEAAVYDELVRCGMSIATEATNTFLRFLMKILTPAVFAKKVPDFWARDNRGGSFSVDTSEASSGRIQMALSGVAGYDHIGASAIGWIRFGMKATGKDVTVEQSGWSLANPGPDRIEYRISWSV